MPTGWMAGCGAGCGTRMEAGIGAGCLDLHGGHELEAQQAGHCEWRRAECSWACVQEKDGHADWTKPMLSTDMQMDCWIGLGKQAGRMDVG